MKRWLMDMLPGMNQLLNDRLLSEMVLIGVTLLSGLAAMAGVIVAIFYWPFGTINVLLLLVAVLLWHILQALNRIVQMPRGV
jgi:hypothetical protein